MGPTTWLLATNTINSVWCPAPPSSVGALIVFLVFYIRPARASRGGTLLPRRAAAPRGAAAAAPGVALQPAVCKEAYSHHLVPRNFT